MMPGHCDESSRPAATGLVTDLELELALEDVERIDVLLVEMRPGTFVGGTALVLEERHVLPGALDEDLALLVLDELAFAGTGEDRLHAGEL